jgi:hypothetical protein
MFFLLKKKMGEIQRKVGKFGQTSKILIFVFGKFGEKSGKTHSTLN